MSHLEDVSTQIDTFLKHDTKRVLLLKGKWGVGKTHFFSKIYLPRCKGAKQNEKIIQESKVSYVSLNGVASIDDVEQLIVANTEFQNVEITQKRNFWNRGAEKTLKCLSWTENIPYLKEFQGTIRRIANLLVSDYMICIDEIERKSSELSIDTLLGLVSMLKEHKKCRFVLIMNEDELSSEDKKLFDKCREKVIDEIVTYSPSVKDNVGLIFKNKELADFATDIFSRTDAMNNIRIMQQTKWAVEYFLPHLEGISANLKQSFIRNTMQLSVFFYVKSLDIDLSFVREDLIHAYVVGSQDETSKSPRQKLKNKFILYQFNRAEYDQFIVDYLENGTCNINQLRPCLDALNIRDDYNQMMANWHNIEKSVFSNLNTNDNEIFEQTQTFILNNAAHMDFNYLSKAINFITMIKPSTSKESYFDSWVSARLKSVTMKELVELAKLPISEAMRVNLHAEQGQRVKGRTVLELIRSLKQPLSEFQEIIILVNNFSKEEIKDSFLTINTEEDFILLQAFLQILDNTNDSSSTVKEKITWALQQIETTSLLNKFRISILLPEQFVKETKEPDVDKEIEHVL